MQLEYVSNDSLNASEVAEYAAQSGLTVETTPVAQDSQPPGLPKLIDLDSFEHFERNSILESLASEISSSRAAVHTYYPNDPRLVRLLGRGLIVASDWRNALIRLTAHRPAAA